MPITCVAFGCPNRQRRRKDKDGGVRRITFHRFPTRDKRLRQEWENAVQRKNADGTPWRASRWSVLCSEHFRPEDFYYFKGYSHQRNMLKEGIVPSVFKAYPPRLQRIVKNNYIKYKKEYEEQAKAKIQRFIEIEASLNIDRPKVEPPKPFESPVVKDHYDHCYFVVRPGVSLEISTMQDEDESSRTITSLRRQVTMLQEQLARKERTICQLKGALKQYQEEKRQSEDHTYDKCYDEVADAAEPSPWKPSTIATT